MLIDQERERRNDARRHRLEGEERMKALKDRDFVHSLIKSTGFDDRKIASLTGVGESFVRQQRRHLSHSS